MSNTDEFWKAIKNRPAYKKREIIYRAFYEGKKILYMRSGPADDVWPEDFDWIDITKKEYNETRPAYNIIVDGKIVAPPPSDTTWIKLERAEEGPFTSAPNNIIFAADKGDNYKFKDYE